VVATKRLDREHGLWEPLASRRSALRAAPGNYQISANIRCRIGDGHSTPLLPSYEGWRPIRARPVENAYRRRLAWYAGR
jgi:hypothetical protein